MKHSIVIFILALTLLVSACGPRADATPQTGIATPRVQVQTSTDSTPSPNQYTNESFGLSFEFPGTWYGPSEYVSGNTVRVEVGSDTVYPYGEPPEQPSSVRDSYSVVIQYTTNNQNDFWKETYGRLQAMQDGESWSDARAKLIRIRQIDLGRFGGFEYISTLSDTAQTEAAYVRSVTLFDPQTNDLITITGQPNNVELGSGANWMEVFQALDARYLSIFRGILASLSFTR